MLILYRVAHGRDAMTQTRAGLLPQHLTQPTLSIRINTEMSSVVGEQFSASPMKPNRGFFDSPRTSFPPPYGECSEIKTGIIPPSPSVDLAYTTEGQKLGVKRTTWS
jgi:hypothetical protein